MQSDSASGKTAVTQMAQVSGPVLHDSIAIEADHVKSTILFKPPFVCRLNTDSLKSAQKKALVMMPEDTMAKGFSLMLPNEELVQNSYTRVMSPSIFKTHALQPVMLNPEPRTPTDNNWMSIHLVFVFYLLGALRLYYQKRLKMVLDAFFIPRYANMLMREENVFGQRTSLILLLLFLLSSSLFYYQLNAYYGWSMQSYNPPGSYLVILVMVGAFYGIRLLLNRFAGFMFKRTKECTDYLFHYVLVLQVCGLAMLPVVTMLAFTSVIPAPGLFIAGGLILAVAAVVRIIRGLGVIQGSGRVSLFYIFLYICTLEVLPVLMVYKMVIKD